MPGCCVLKCSNRHDKGFKLYKLPQGERNVERRNLWLRNIGRKEVSENSRVCEIHFTEDQFENKRKDGKKRLKWNAVPTLFGRGGAAVPAETIPAVDEAGTSAVVEGEEYYNEEEREWTEKMDTGQLCRVCANPNEYMIPIFEGEGLEHQLALKVKKHLPIKVTETDVLPQQMCYQCASTLIAWHDLVICCVEADKKLRELQAEDDEEDRDAEAFEAPSYDSDIAEGNVESKEDSVADKEESDKVPVKLSPTKRTSQLVKEKKSKLKVERPSDKSTENAETASQEELSESVKPKEGASQDPSNERLCGFGEDIPSVTQEMEHIGTIKSEGKTDSVYSVWITGEDEQEYYLCDVKKFEGEESTCTEILEGSAAELVDHDYVQSTRPSASLFTGNAMNQVSLKCVKVKGKCRAKVVISNQPVNCSYCNKKFSCEALALTHMRKHTNYYPFFCKNCGKSFMLSSSLGNHLVFCNGSKDDKVDPTLLQPIIKRENERYVCAICGKVYKLKSSLKDHLNAHMGKVRRKQKCVACGEKFLTKAEIKEHMQLHANMLLSCPVCSKMFINQRDLSDHTISHKDDRPFTCAKCGVSYKRKSHLTRHELCHLKQSKRMPRMLQKPGTTYSCEYCGKECISPRLLAQHLVSHTGERNFGCQICGKHFAQSGAVSRHMRVVHGGAKDYYCDICGRSFTAKATKDNHMRIHTGEKPYQCENCGKTFRTQQQHHIHERVHTDARPYPCLLCTKRFRRRPHLVVHMRTHTGEKPYACKICGRCFAQKNDVTKHMLVHNRNRYVRV